MVTGAELLFLSTHTIFVVFVQTTPQITTAVARVPTVEDLATIHRRLQEPERVEPIPWAAPAFIPPVPKPQPRALGYRGVRYPTGFV